MKKIAAVMLVFASFIFSASAQEQRKIKHHQHHHANGMMMKELTLTQSQKEQIKASHDGYKNQTAYYSSISFHTFCVYKLETERKTN